MRLWVMWNRCMRLWVICEWDVNDTWMIWMMCWFGNVGHITMVWMHNPRSIMKLGLQSICSSLNCSDSIWVTFNRLRCRFETHWHTDTWHPSRGCRHGPFCGSCQQRLARKARAGSGCRADVVSAGCHWGSSLLCLPRFDRFLVWKMGRGGLLAKHLKLKSWSSTLQKSSKSWCSKSSAEVVFFHTLLESVLKEIPPYAFRQEANL